MAAMLPTTSVGVDLIIIAILLAWAIVALVVWPRHRASAGQENLPRSLRNRDENDEQRKAG